MHHLPNGQRALGPGNQGARVAQPAGGLARPFSGAELLPAVINALKGILA